MSHSPGPWRWNPEEHSRNVLEDALGEPIVFYDPVFSRAQAVANKTLIAAAPRMLEFLREMEWAGNESVGTCPVCSVRAHNMHRHGAEYDKTPCRLGALLAELAKAGV